MFNILNFVKMFDINNLHLAKLLLATSWTIQKIETPRTGRLTFFAGRAGFPFSRRQHQHQQQRQVGAWGSFSAGLPGESPSSFSSILLPAEPAFLSRDANNTTQHNTTQHNTNRLGLGVSFSAGLPGWLPLLVFIGFVCNPVVRHKLAFRAGGPGMSSSFGFPLYRTCTPQIFI